MMAITNTNNDNDKDNTMDSSDAEQVVVIVNTATLAGNDLFRRIIPVPIRCRVPVVVMGVLNSSIVTLFLLVPVSMVLYRIVSVCSDGKYR
jgi:hypothetical protein